MWYHDDLASKAVLTQKHAEAADQVLDARTAVRSARATAAGKLMGVRVTWEPPEDETFKVDGYRLTRLRQQPDPNSPVGQRLFTWQQKSESFVPATQLYFDQDDLAENTTFRYKVTAFHYNQSRRKIYGKQSMTNKFTVYEPLPEGWASADTDEGQRYYFNIVTRHRQWEKPEENSRTFLPMTLAKQFTPDEVGGY